MTEQDDLIILYNKLAISPIQQSNHPTYKDLKVGFFTKTLSYRMAHNTETLNVCTFQSPEMLKLILSIPGLYH